MSIIECMNFIILLVQKSVFIKEYLNIKKRNIYADSEKTLSAEFMAVILGGKNGVQERELSFFYT